MPESILLKWMTYHFARAMPTLARRVTNFSTDLKSGRGCIRGVLKVYWGCIVGVFGVYWERYRGVMGVYLGCIRGVGGVLEDTQEALSQAGMSDLASSACSQRPSNQVSCFTPCSSTIGRRSSPS